MTSYDHIWNTAKPPGHHILSRKKLWKAFKYVQPSWSIALVHKLKWQNLPTLAFRRLRGDMIEIFKHFHTYDKPTLSQSFLPQKYPSRQHKFQLVQRKPKGGKRGLQQNSFYYRCQEIWNKLPSNVVDAEDINSFKNSLDAYWKNHPMRFNHSYREIPEEQECE